MASQTNPTRSCPFLRQDNKSLQQRATTSAGQVQMRLCFAAFSRAAGHTIGIRLCVTRPHDRGTKGNWGLGAAPM